MDEEEENYLREDAVGEAGRQKKAKNEIRDHIRVFLFSFVFSLLIGMIQVRLNKRNFAETKRNLV